MRYARTCLVLVVLTACNRLPDWPKRVGGVQDLNVASSGHILVTAHVDGHPQVFILDTGANITSLSSRAARALAIPATAPYRINNSIAAAKGTMRELDLAGVEH